MFSYHTSENKLTLWMLGFVGAEPTSGLIPRPSTGRGERKGLSWAEGEDKEGKDDRGGWGQQD